MKFLEAKAANGETVEKSILPENKMKPGSRPDQRDPQSLISSPHHSTVKSNIESLAKELGVDLSTVQGTGENGAITAKDVRAAKRVQTQSSES